MKQQTGLADCRPQLPIVHRPRIKIPFSCLALLVFISACQTPAPAPPDTRAADERSLREADAAWSKAAGSGDVDKTVSYYAPDVVVLPPNGPAITSKEGIRDAWKGMITGPGAHISWQATRVDVARSGDLGYVSGPYEFVMSGPDGKPVTERGKFVEVWRKQADGAWKCVADIWNSDLAAPAPAEKK